MKNQKFEVGEKVKLKKPHPCGANKWEIRRVGMDFKVKCLKCGRLVMMSRREFEKDFKEKINK